MRRKDGMPDLVFYGLMGIATRAAAFVYLSVALTVAVGSTILGFTSHPAWFYGALLFLAALWYWYCIRWVDKHSNWSP